jgi:adenylate cyclase
MTGQLIEVSNQTHLWADRFDGRMDDIFDLQDRIASSVIGAIVPNIEKAEIALAIRKPTESLSAYYGYLRGLSSFYQFTRDGHLRALPLFMRAAEIDPTFALTAWYITGKAYAWIEGNISESPQAEKVAREALSLSGDDPRVLAHAGQALTYVAMKVDEGAAILSRAVEIDPNLAIARLWLGGANIFQGKFDDAIEPFALALRLSPFDPRTFLSYSGLATAHFHLSCYEEALKWASNGVRRWPDFVQLHRQMMAALAMLGRHEEAALSRANVVRLNPTLTIGEFRRTTGLVRKDDIEKVVAAWRLAGMPE